MPVTKKAALTGKPAVQDYAPKIVVQNVNVPGYTHRVDSTMYNAMRQAMLKMLPRKAPGMTQTEMWQTLPRFAPIGLFPDSGKIGWWMKTVQLDLEAKKIIFREPTKPLRWHRRR